LHQIKKIEQMKFIPSFIIFIMIMAFSAVNASAQTTSTEEIVQDKMEVITVKVKGVGCMGDLKDIANSVKKLDGVSRCKEGKMGATSTFVITYDPAIITKKAIHEAIEGTPGCSNPDTRPYKVK
jgi:copper chaperone CopZ